MDKTYHIEYVDAYYIYTKNIGQTKLSLFESYGYIKINVDNIIVAFVKRKISNGKEEVGWGLVIPNTALFSMKDTINKEILKNLKTGMSVAVTWRDVVAFDYGSQRKDCPIMYTEGILVRIKSDHIVLKDPETIGIYPGSIRNHPQEKPTFYIIPISLITDVVIIK